MYKIGIGYDAHRLVHGESLILGGVSIQHEKGLLGHSDADVLIHAIIDAIVGALGLGDIGKLFPDSDDRYKGICSVELLVSVRKLMFDKGYSIGNVDCTIVAQKPRLSAYNITMKKNIANALMTEEENVNIKATTEEGMGFTGNEEGISAMAVCLIKKTD